MLTGKIGFCLLSVIGLPDGADSEVVDTANEASEIIVDSVNRIGINKLNPIIVKLISIAIAIVFTVVICRVIHHFIKKYIFESNSDKITGSHVTHANIIYNLIRFLLIIFCIIVILDIIGINITGFVAGLGVVGAIAGLAAQDLLKDFIAGTNIASEGFFVIGDVIECQGYVGTVTSLSMRSTKIKTLDGSIVTIQNHLIDKARVISTENAVNISLPYDLERAKAYKLVDEIIKEVEKVPDITKAVSGGISSFEDSAIQYMILFYCSPDISKRMKRKVNDIVIMKLDAAGVEIPFNQLDIHQK